MYTVTWIVAGVLFSISTPDAWTAGQVASRMPLARMWWKGAGMVRPVMMRIGAD